MFESQYLTDLLLAWLAYFLLTISPGPAVLAIVSGAAAFGRGAAMAIAAGVLLGSLFWGVLAAMGLSTVLAYFPIVTEGLRVAGSLFLFWLASKAVRSAMSSEEVVPPISSKKSATWGFFLKGLLIHLTNPKAIFGWMAIIAIGVSPGSAAYTSLWVISGCFLIGCLVFFGYGLMFSAQRIRSGYQRIRRYVQAVVAAIFGYAGLKLLMYQE